MPLKDFKIEKKVGKGSFGSVYRATRKSDERTYALKKVSIKDMPKKERQEAVNEIRLLASISHSNIIKYCDAFCEGNDLYIVTEFARRGDLGGKISRHKQRSERMPEKTIWTFFVQICQALEYMHSRDILHRDLKPMNVLCYSTEHVCLADLGCSKLMKARLPHTQVGTPYYMAPEIWKHQRYDTKCDVWSLGILLYELCALSPPFSANDLNGLASKVKYNDPPKISSKYSGELATMIKSMLKKEPTKRPSIPEILRKINGSEAIQAHLPSRGIDNVLKASIVTACDESHVKMLPTIQVPYNIKQLKLPPARYPTADPSGRPKSAPERGGGKGRSEETARPTHKDQYQSKAHRAPASKYANMAVRDLHKEGRGGGGGGGGNRQKASDVYGGRRGGGGGGGANPSKRPTGHPARHGGRNPTRNHGGGGGGRHGQYGGRRN